MLRVAHTEALLVWRGYASFAILATALLAVLVFGQEPIAFRRARLGIGWGSARALLLLVVAAASLAWALQRPVERAGWERRSSASPIPLVLARFLGVSAGGSAVGLIGLGLIYTVERIVCGPSSARGAPGLLLQIPLVAMLLAAVAPLVARPRHLSTRVLVWLAMLIDGMGAFGRGLVLPLDRVFALDGTLVPDQGRLALAGPTVVAVALALAGGLGVALALELRPRARSPGS